MLPSSLLKAPFLTNIGANDPANFVSYLFPMENTPLVQLLYKPILTGAFSHVTPDYF